MNMFARFYENPAMTLQDIKETKRYGRTHTRTDGQRENSIPTTNKVCGGPPNTKFVGGIKNRPQGYKTFFMLNSTEHKISTAHKN